MLSVPRLTCLKVHKRLFFTVHVHSRPPCCPSVGKYNKCLLYCLSGGHSQISLSLWSLAVLIRPLFTSCRQERTEKKIKEILVPMTVHPPPTRVNKEECLVIRIYVEINHTPSASSHYYNWRKCWVLMVDQSYDLKTSLWGQTRI